MKSQTAYARHRRVREAGTTKAQHRLRWRRDQFSDGQGRHMPGSLAGRGGRS